MCDDKIGVIGSKNLDYRSLCHHFECGVWLYNTKTIFDMKKDYLETLDVCMEITEEYCKNVPLLKRITRELLKFFAPLM